MWKHANTAEPIFGDAGPQLHLPEYISVTSMSQQQNLVMGGEQRVYCWEKSDDQHPPSSFGPYVRDEAPGPPAP